MEKVILKMNMNGNRRRTQKMKKIFTYTLLAISLFSLASCIQREEVSLDDMTVDMVFSAVVSDHPGTRTVIDGELGDNYRSTLWLPGDSIGITSGNYSAIHKFINTKTEESELGIFEGEAVNSTTHYAIYPYAPYSTDTRMEGNIFYFNIPDRQKYLPNSFAQNAAPMVAKTTQNDGRLDFYNLCGVLVIKLIGEESISSVTFSGKNENGVWAKVSGKWGVDMTYDSIPSIMSTEKSHTSVTVYSDEGVQLDSSEPTPFYMVLPPATYNEFMLTIATTDGKIMIKEGTKPLTIKRANVTVSSPLIYTESVSVDLCDEGTANCYIVSDPGIYSIDASTIGNGVFGIIEGSGFHTDDPTISPVRAEILWTDNPTVVTSVTCDKDSRKISFMVPGVEGNALIAAKDENGTILWSWHIWVTDTPENQTYVNNAGTFEVMDRNLGAISSEKDSGDDAVRDTDGMVYQWGRKDPFAPLLFTRTDAYITYTIKESVENPTHFVGTSTWMNPDNKKLWEPDMKTIYDPCPQGYRVAVSDVWAGFLNGDDQYNKESYNVEGEFDKGWNFIIDSLGTKAWYPVTPLIYYYYSGNDYQYRNNGSHIWSSDCNEDENPRALRFYYNDENNMYLNVSSEEDDGHAFPVRCMRDDAEYPGTPRVLTVGVDSITKTSAIVRSKVLYEGETAVTERGIVWGMDDNISIETGNVIKNDETSDEYMIAIESLQHSTTYYVRAYAVNSEGVSYGAVVSFTTEYDGVAEDLSVYGTANSYIIPAAGVYKFKAVKGNSDELLEGAVSADILWTTFGTTDIPRSGEIVTKVSYSDGYLTLFVPSPLKEGNALVAVRNAEGTILWSWHIWLVNFDPDATAQTYQSGAVMMDRNLGATSVQDQDPKAYGLLYQWGRKDPSVGAGELNQSIFAQTYPADIIQYKWESGSLEYSIQNPTVVIGESTWNIDNTLWTSAKTIYDPCPIGWRVPDGGPGVWDSWKNPTKSLNNGVIFGAPYSVPDAYYPQGGYTEGSHYLNFVGRASYNWSCTPVDSSDYAYNFHFYSGYGRPMDTRNRDHQYNVRCQKDIEYEKESLPEVVIITSSDVTTTSATVSCEVKSSGYEDVNDRGVVYGIEPNPTLETGIRIQSGSGVGPYSVSLTSLEPATRYFVRAYAVSDLGTSYSEDVRITTANDGTYKDLSANGTANSYIVPGYGYYSFDATVKGNGLEPIDGTPVSAEVIWETRNIADAISTGDVVENVSLKNGKVLFNTSEDFNQGNALIAVKDASGKILWSWHIWVSYYDSISSYHLYPSGAVMMDRNLGALSNGTDYLSNGLLFQWGRKDPFIGAGGENVPAATAPENVIEYVVVDNQTGTMQYSIENPASVLYNGNNGYWLYNSGESSSKWDKEKTVYDPCPVGWIVPRHDIHIWDNSGIEYPNHSYSVDGVSSKFGNDYWILGGNARYNYYSDYEDAFTVRCERERHFSVHTLSFTSTINSVTVSANMLSDGDKEILERGVVIATYDGYLYVHKADLKVVDESAEMLFGSYEITISGLTSNTTYYARAYAITENGIEYGETIVANTKSTGNNEGVGDDDYEW